MEQQPILIDLPEELTGPRVVVRPFREEDARQVWEAVDESRERLEPWLPWVAGYRSPDDAVSFVRRARASFLLREDLVVGIFERESGGLLGGSGLHRIDWRIRAFEIGYWLRNGAEGRGYMRETVQLLTWLAFERLGANRVEIRMDPENVRSRRVPEGLGFVFEGTLRNCTAGRDGGPRDSHVFALIPEDYGRLDWPDEIRRYVEA